MVSGRRIRVRSERRDKLRLLLSPAASVSEASISTPSSDLCWSLAPGVSASCGIPFVIELPPWPSSSGPLHVPGAVSLYKSVRRIFYIRAPGFLSSDWREILWLVFAWNFSCQLFVYCSPRNLKEDTLLNLFVFYSLLLFFRCCICNKARELLSFRLKPEIWS